MSFGYKMIIYQSLLYFFLIFFHLASAQDIGKVIVNGFGNVNNIETNTSNYRFSLNDGSNKYLHVSLLVLDPTGQSVELNQTTQVTCEQLISLDGYTSVTFTTVIFTVGGPDIQQIRITPVAAGRNVEVGCYGESAPSSECPQSSTSSYVQFCRSTSYSQLIHLTLEPSPIVSFCEPNIKVSSGNTGSFTVKLSDPVTVSSVIVSCTQTISSGSINLTISDVTVSIGSTNVQISYIVINTGSDVIVTCTANSISGTQYITSTSTGTSSSAVFMEDIGSMTLSPTFTNIFTTYIEVFLQLDQSVISTGDVSGVCQVTMVETLEEAQTLYNTPECLITTTTTPTPTSTQSTRLTSPWILDEDVFQFQRDEYYKSIIARRQYGVINDITEYVVITCCTRAPSINKYNNINIAMITQVSLTSNICPNCTGGPVSGVKTEERLITNPAFVEISPCSCDITYQMCDIECCCDKECSDDIKRTFTSCIGGLKGGFPGDVPERSCASTNPFKDDWFPLMCVMFEENSFLGLYYNNQPKITTEQELNVQVNSQKNLFQLSKNEKRYTDNNAALRGYQYGADIRTVRQDISLPDKGFLSLPQHSANGGCIHTAPIQYLKNFESTCTSAVKPELCVINSVLSARVYVESSTIFRPPCPESFQICEQYGGDTIAPSVVNYYCADDSYMQNYVKDSVTYSDLVQPQVSWMFNSSLATEDCTNPCDNSNCTDYNMDRHITNRPLPSRCTWDDGFTRAPIPEVSGGSCLNTVLDVRYKFVWNGQNVLRLEADIIMGPVSVQSASSLSQLYSVEFNQESDIANRSSDNFNDLAESYERSGSPGYEFGKPLFSGCSNITNGFSGVDMDPIKQMAVWSPGVDGLCINAGRQFLTFGDDTISSCLLRLNLDDLNDCDNLKTLTWNHLNTLMPSNVLGKQGYNNPNNQSFWIDIMREDMSEVFDDSTTVNSTDNTTSLTYLLNGICTNITTGIHLTILYGETGRANGYPIYEILGAKVSYTIDEWKLSCIGSNSILCQTNSTFVESFILSSSINYIQIPAQTPPPIIKFWTQNLDPSCQTDSCQRYYENFDTSICHYDTCWHELYYPLSSAYTADSRLYTLAFTLVFIIFILAYYIVVQKHKVFTGINKDNSIGNIINTFPTECFT